MVKKGSYLVVMDTCCEMIYQNWKNNGKELPECLNRPWGLGDNPMSAVKKFLITSDRFVIDKSIDAKLQISCAPNGYLRCIKD